MGPLIPLALFARIKCLSSNVVYIHDRDRHLLTWELVSDGSTNTVGFALFTRLCSRVRASGLFALFTRFCFGYPIVLWGSLLWLPDCALGFLLVCFC